MTNEVEDLLAEADEAWRIASDTTIGESALRTRMTQAHLAMSKALELQDKSLRLWKEGLFVLAIPLGGLAGALYKASWPALSWLPLCALLLITGAAAHFAWWLLRRRWEDATT